MDRDEQEWPIARTQWTKYYLHEDGSFSTAESDDFRFSFKADSEGVNFFTEPLTEEIEITGPAAASLLISSSTSDADIFLTIRVLDPDGNDVSFVLANDPCTHSNAWWVFCRGRCAWGCQAPFRQDDRSKLREQPHAKLCTSNVELLYRTFS